MIMVMAGLKTIFGFSKWTVQEVAESVKEDFGTIGILVHLLANEPEVNKPLLETPRSQHRATHPWKWRSTDSTLDGSTVSLTCITSDKIIPCYGRGMSSAKAALESVGIRTGKETWDRSHRHFCRYFSISCPCKKRHIRPCPCILIAGPLRSHAVKAIGFIDVMIDYSPSTSPPQKELLAKEVWNAAAFLCLLLASATSGSIT
ncbi:hypothetical protein MLD38_015945 [Melastoma candidum]|uniref:Uncharacterized protein n=1 Tax=Melastoma candidum TaxID=119954 RepID=A0ACB9RM02_9MYRT|nr:hypothetical protein MLD38_015945 [Melastoma candidum]